MENSRRTSHTRETPRTRKWVIPRFVFPRDKSGRGVATKSFVALKALEKERAHLSRALTAYEWSYGDTGHRDTRYRTDLSSWQFRTLNSKRSSLLAAQHRRTNWPLEKLRVAYMINRTFPPFPFRPSFQGLKLLPLPPLWLVSVTGNNISDGSGSMYVCVCVCVCKVLQKEARALAKVL